MKLVLFDVDGTLIDSQAIILESQRRTLAEFGIAHPGRERGLSIVGLSLPQAFTALIGGGYELSPILDRYGQVFGALRADPAWRSPLFEGAAGVIGELARRDDIQLGLATGKSRRGVAHLLDQQGWHGHFVTIQTADTNPSKPHPDMVLAAMREAGVAATDTIVIGDTSFDMEMARAAGAHAIGVAWGYHDRQTLLASGAQRIATSFADIVQWIDDDR